MNKTLLNMKDLPSRNDLIMNVTLSKAFTFLIEGALSNYKSDLCSSEIGNVLLSSNVWDIAWGEFLKKSFFNKTSENYSTNLNSYLLKNSSAYCGLNCFKAELKLFLGFNIWRFHE